ncbi:MAG: hypothetical protein KAG56_01805 [Sulfurovaceae bacterium]|nr:hypothetical protein [Sulfurovaceae bacterium]
MSISINIGNILNSSTETFHEILDTLQKRNIEFSKKELMVKHEFDSTLINAILLTLEMLKEEEGVISRLVYSSFGIGKNKNKRREQLIILGSQLKSQLSDREKSMRKIRHYKENLHSSKKNLTRLHKAFKDKIPFLNSYTLQNRAINYMRETNRNIETIKTYQDELEIRANHINNSIGEYRKVLRQIPRYHELREEVYVQLIEPRAEDSNL